MAADPSCSLIPGTSDTRNGATDCYRFKSWDVIGSEQAWKNKHVAFGVQVHKILT